jgi:hypothetical protein
MAVCQNRVPLVNIKIAGKWMFIPLKMVLIGIDPYPYIKLYKQNLSKTITGHGSVCFWLQHLAIDSRRSLHGASAVHGWNGVPCGPSLGASIPIMYGRSTSGIVTEPS